MSRLVGAETHLSLQVMHTLARAVGERAIDDAFDQTPFKHIISVVPPLRSAGLIHPVHEAIVGVVVPQKQIDHIVIGCDVRWKRWIGGSIGCVVTQYIKPMMPFAPVPATPIRQNAEVSVLKAWRITPRHHCLACWREQKKDRQHTHMVPRENVLPPPSSQRRSIFLITHSPN
jgi:hypothetical protein